MSGDTDKLYRIQSELRELIVALEARNTILFTEIDGPIVSSEIKTWFARRLRGLIEAPEPSVGAASDGGDCEALSKANHEAWLAKYSTEAERLAFQAGYSVGEALGRIYASMGETQKPLVSLDKG